MYGLEFQRGATCPVMFATKYTDTLTAFLIPFAEPCMAADCTRITIQNTQVGGSRFLCLQQHSITWWKSPSKTLDLKCEILELPEGEAQAIEHG